VLDRDQRAFEHSLHEGRGGVGFRAHELDDDAPERPVQILVERGDPASTLGRELRVADRRGNAVRPGGCQFERDAQVGLELRVRPLDARQRCLHLGVPVREVVLDQLRQHPGAGVEVGVHAVARDPGRLPDPRRGHGRRALGDEQLTGRGEQHRTPSPAVLDHGWRVDPGHHHHRARGADDVESGPREGRWAARGDSIRSRP